ncbi:MAG: ClpX C4-type zinc finger protein [Labedaea sp.]
MVVDEGLLRQARESGAQLSDALRQADVAKADYHHSVRRLHYAGASMREIADALELSHQRVHQIIEATGGTGGWKASRKPEGEMSCGFCGRCDAEVSKLIAGPGIFICDGCVALARRVADEAAPLDTLLAPIEPLPTGSRLKCSFCTQPNSRVSAVIAGNRLAVCPDCIQLCEEVLAAAGEAPPLEQ